MIIKLEQEEKHTILVKTLVVLLHHRLLQAQVQIHHHLSCINMNLLTMKMKRNTEKHTGTATRITMIYTTMKESTNVCSISNYEFPSKTFYKYCLLYMTNESRKHN